MMQKYKAKNDRTIHDGFRELGAYADIICANALCNVLNMAMQRILDDHDHTHFGHRLTGDSYGWMVFHDGKEYEDNINRGSYGTGNALELLREAGRERAIRGWSGILLASMEIDFKGRKPLFLEVQYEQDLLNSAADWTDKKLESYFREISR